ncbi:MAG: TetR/AcrR family transcriptional regulator [Solirubrobacterales bacterium]|nr:TetR/AcrR family transcriptional regulator [Solirubrobacterales bacterium]MBV9367236.1 TetR/AcrR family transcriptional regulator [Solirubrobacterales bacterium]MBV9809844.1 TetR/AcrR family transcriptional regulator [Solirubrobacterales bacterium]
MTSPSSSSSSDATSRHRRPYAPRLPPEQRREQLIDAALEVILERGYARISIEAIARAAGITRPVVYDHFADLNRLLHAVVEREERISLDQLAEVVPDEPGDQAPRELLARGVSRFLDAVMSRPATWRIILLPLEGTPPIVRQHVEAGRTEVLARIQRLLQWALDRRQLPRELDVELTARAIRDWSEQAGRMVLTDPERYPPERYERYAHQFLDLLGSA